MTGQSWPGLMQSTVSCLAMIAPSLGKANIFVDR